MNYYVGLDIHKTFCHATIMAEDGTIVKSGRIEANEKKLQQFFIGIENAEVVIEASGMWEPYYNLLERLGYQVVLSHPLKTRVIAEARVKTDKIDSQILAHLLRADLLPRSYIPPKNIRELRNIVRHRIFLVRNATRMKNKIRAELLKRGWKRKDIFTTQGKQWLRSLEIDEITSCLSVLDQLFLEIKRSNEKITSLTLQNDQARILTTIPGIGYYSALLIVSEIGDVMRFPSSGKLCAYAGLVPSVHQSGMYQRYGHITKTGSKYLRWILVEAVHSHVRFSKSSHLTHYYNRLWRRKGKKVAVVATARKMLKVIYWMLKEQKPFRVKGELRAVNCREGFNLPS